MGFMYSLKLYIFIEYSYFYIFNKLVILNP